MPIDLTRQMQPTLVPRAADLQRYVRGKSQMNTKAKRKRRNQGKRWAAEYVGNNIIHAYKKKFKIPLITAINDLNAIGVQLDQNEVAKIKLDRHHYNEQQLSKKTIQDLCKSIQNSEDSFPLYDI